MDIHLLCLKNRVTEFAQLPFDVVLLMGTCQFETLGDVHRSRQPIFVRHAEVILKHIYRHCNLPLCRWFVEHLIPFYVLVAEVLHPFDGMECISVVHPESHQFSPLDIAEPVAIVQYGVTCHRFSH